MKYFVAVSIFASIQILVSLISVNALTNQRSGDYCPINEKYSHFSYTSLYGGIENMESDIQTYISEQLAKSLEYLLLATNFNSYEMNRPGFQKLFQELSDRCFQDAINLTKHLTLRGGTLNLTNRFVGPATVNGKFPELELSELESIKLALECEKQLAKGAIHIHSLATHSNITDPEFADYVEKRFLGKQAVSVRRLAGFVNDLQLLYKSADRDVALYLFDEFLCGTQCVKRGLHG